MARIQAVATARTMIPQKIKKYLNEYMINLMILSKSIVVMKMIFLLQMKKRKRLNQRN